MNYLIKGGEFNNKGAEAMTLVLIKNIYEHDVNAVIYMVYPKKLCPFEFVKPIYFFDIPWPFVMIKMEGSIIKKIKLYMKEFIKLFVPNKRSYLTDLKNVASIVKKTDVLIDISGFKLGDKWGEEAAITYCDWIRIFKDNGAKVYLMPQSFGSFSFSDKTMKFIVASLKRVDIIHAREKSGYDVLKKLGLNNVVLFNDSVLIEKQFDAGKIIKDIQKYKEDILVTSKHNIGVIPNARLFDKGNVNQDLLLDFYIKIIAKNAKDTNYYYLLLAHAGEDLEICRRIKKAFPNNENVVLVNHVLYSFNYEELTKKLDFIVASRYHSIVHAYKEGTPAVIIGWSDKYNEVAGVFEQREYIVDTNVLDDGLTIFDNMLKNYIVERDKISNKLEEVQSVSCYDFLKEI